MARPNQGPRVSEKPNEKGFYEIRWTENGRSKRHSTGKTVYQEAIRYFASYLAELERGREELDGPEVPTVSDVMSAYIRGHIEDMPHPDSKHQWGVCARMVRASCLGGLLATVLTPEDVKRYGKDRAAGRIGYTEDGKRRGYRKGGPAAFRNEMLCLNAALRYCVDNRKFSGLTLASLTPVKVPPPPKPRDHWWTTEQAQAVLVAAKERCKGNRYDRLYLFVLICLDTASRKEPVESLTWDRVFLTLDTKTHQWSGYIDFQEPDRPETKKRRGINYVSPETAGILASAREQADNENPYVLGEPTTCEFAFRRLAANVLGEDEETGPHILRHSWATWAANAGVSMFDIAGVLHDSVRTVERVYAKHAPKNRMAAVNQIAALRITASAAPVNDAFLAPGSTAEDPFRPDIVARLMGREAG